MNYAPPPHTPENLVRPVSHFAIKIFWRLCIYAVGKKSRGKSCSNEQRIAEFNSRWICRRREKFREKIFVHVDRVGYRRIEASCEPNNNVTRTTPWYIGRRLVIYGISLIQSLESQESPGNSNCNEFDSWDLTVLWGTTKKISLEVSRWKTNFAGRQYLFFKSTSIKHYLIKQWNFYIAT